MNLKSAILFFVLLWAIQAVGGTVPLEKISLPKGFKIEVYADDVENARQMALGDKGTVFVGTRGGKVYALVDNNQDQKVDEVITIAEGLNAPNGVVFKDGNLYVGEINCIIRFDDIENRLKNPPKPVVINDTLPDKIRHGFRYLGFGPDGLLYTGIGAPCNVCVESDPRFGSMVRMKPDGSNFEIFAKGVRNSVGFDWDPVTKQLWFTDNGRDLLGDNIPPDELNHAPKVGMNFGFPYVYGNNVPDPEFGKLPHSEPLTKPAQPLGPHVAPLGMIFYQGDMFPNAYKNRIIIAEHGSWNRSQKIGYRLTTVTVDKDKAGHYETFVEGFLQNEIPWGRPVDVMELNDGSLLVSDDFANKIYRISYSTE